MDEELTIDYVLVYESEEYSEKRSQFENKLEQSGLILSTDVETSLSQHEKPGEGQRKFNFLKIHAPNHLLEDYCERLKMKMPMKNGRRHSRFPEKRSFWSSLNCTQISDLKRILKCSFSKAQRHLFATESENFFTPIIRIEVVNHILNKTPFMDGPDTHYGLQKLLVDKVYTAAYPLHESSAKDKDNARTHLNRQWATMKKWNSEQPLDQIKEYFGVQVALYFAWLGFYTKMLIPLAVMGVFCFLYGLIEVFTDPINAAIKKSSILMCPNCISCEPTSLSSMYSKLKWLNLFDNKLFPTFAAIVSIWSTLYFEVWKRYSARLMYHWDMTDYVTSIQPTRPEYVKMVRKHNIKKRNNVTNEEEFVPDTWSPYKTYFISYSTVLFFIGLAVAAVAIIKIMQTVSNSEFFSDFNVLSTLVSGMIRLSIIVALNKIYRIVAKWLTDHEYHRTQAEYDNNLALKIYIFQFVNYYSSLFYLAFIKGHIAGYPGHYNTIEIGSQTYRHQACQNGCFMEMSVQLVIIMVGKQIFLGSFKEMLPLILNIWTNMWKAKRSGHNESDKQWVRDYYLTPVPELGLFSEYLEMVVQFGFITIFAVFPLAPLFALLNNIFEVRLDAVKFVSLYRRTNPVRTSNIGIWYKILEILQKVSVISNAFIVAFTSSFIDKTAYYIYYHGPEYNYDHGGYLNHTLSHYSNGTHSCNYFDYRYSDDRNYEQKSDYWELLATRLIFVVLFQNFIGLIQLLVELAIPDVPQDIQDELKKTANLINQRKYEADKNMAVEIVEETQM